MRLMQATPAAQQTKVAFEAILDHKLQFMSFSQRKFQGFRERYEFDQKRILLASGSRISLLGIHP